MVPGWAERGQAADGPFDRRTGGGHVRQKLPTARCPLYRSFHQHKAICLASGTVHVNRQRTFSPAKPYEKHPRDVLPPQTIRDSTPVPSSRPLHVLAADMNGYEAERLRRPASPPHVHKHRVAVVPRARHLDRLEQLVLFTRLVAGVPGG